METITPKAAREFAFGAKLLDALGSFAVSLVIAVLILVVAFWAAGALGGVARRALQRWPRTRHDATLQGFAASVVRYAVMIVALIAVLRRLGVETTSIIAVLGAASLAIGLALQGALSNVAAGVMLLIFRPYKVGDFVEIGGRLGTVRALDLFTTELADPDNLKVVVPNGKVFGEVVVNHSANPTRRMELHFRLDYGDDVERARGLVLEAARGDPRILADPEPWAQVTSLDESAVRLTLRAWTTIEVHWDARFELIQRVKQAFDAAGFAVAYPHQVALQKEPHVR